VRHCHGRLFLGGGSNVASNPFAYRGSKYNDYGVVQLHRPLIVNDGRQNIIEALMMVIFWEVTAICTLPYLLIIAATVFNIV
jgi:hypothetical protein